MKKIIPIQYSVLRYTHDIATGEYLNVGLVVFSKSNNLLKAQLLTRYSRVTNTFPGADGKLLRWFLDRLQRKLDKISFKIESKQRDMFKYENILHILEEVLPKGDTSIHFSVPQGGVCNDFEEFFEDRYFRLIEYYLEDISYSRKDESQIWRNYSESLRDASVISYISKRAIEVPNDKIEFDHTWKNGKVSILEPLSFDLSDDSYIKNKAYKMLGKNVQLNETDKLSNFYYLLAAPKRDDKKLIKAYGESKDILNKEYKSYKIHLIEEDEFEDFNKEIIPIIREAVIHNEE